MSLESLWEEVGAGKAEGTEQSGLGQKKRRGRNLSLDRNWVVKKLTLPLFASS